MARELPFAERKPDVTATCGPPPLESEGEGRCKVENIRFPEGEIGDLELADIIDAEPMQLLMDNFYKLTRMPMGMIDLQGKVLVGVGWQDICTKFHRVHPETCKNCIESDTLLSAGVPQGEYKLYKCRNNLWDVATPIMVGGRHCGNFFMGQFFFDDEPVNVDFFRSQARQYGYDEEAYIAALKNVPRLSRTDLATGMAYFMELAGMISRMSYSNLKLGHALSERDLLMGSLRESEERFRNMFERHEAIMLLIEPESGAIVDANAAAADFYGYSRENLRALYIQDLNQLPPEEVAAERQRVIVEQKSHFVFPHRVASGEVRWVEVYSTPIDAQGKTLLFSVIHDITERKRGEERLRVQARTLKALNSGNRALLHATDELTLLQAVCRTVVEDCGHAMVWIGYAEEDATQSVRPVASAGLDAGYLEALKITWADTERGRGPTGTAIRTGRPSGCSDMRVDPAFAPWRDAALKRGYASSLVLPLLDNGKAFGAITIYSATPHAFIAEEADLLVQLADELAYGIRALRLRVAHDQAYEDLRLAKEAAEAATSAKSQFLANMSHELRTPMTGVLGMLELTLGTQLDAKQRNYLGIAQLSACSLLRILNDILDLTKLEAGKVSVKREPFMLKVCVVGATDLLIPEIQRKGLQFDRFMARDLPELVIGDQLRLGQILVNLIGNAVKFTETGKVEIRVDVGKSVGVNQREFIFTIIDTGIGIPQSKQHLLFRNFSQIDDSNDRRFGGTGLGLAISRDLVELLGGTISFTSKEGEGSVFTMTLPLEVAGAKAGQIREANLSFSAAEAVVGAPDETQPRLLVAEDSPIIRKVLDVMFKNSHYLVDFAEDGQQAVEMWEDEDYDLVLMDVQMPRLTGFEATRAIREKEQGLGGHTPIVAMTAHAFREDEEKCLAAGMDAFLTKPIDFTRCLQVIAEMLERYRRSSRPVL